MSSAPITHHVPLCQGALQSIFLRNWTFINTTNNFTPIAGHPQSHSASTESLLIKVILPIVCCLGITGNVLNVIVLTKRRKSNTLRKLEKSVNLGLTALAASDLLFNVVVFPYCFIPLMGNSVAPEDLAWVYYRIYGVSSINLFLMTSTWLIVLLAVERYIVLYIPLRAKWFSCVNKAKLLIVSVYLCSCAVTLPYFLYLHVTRCNLLDGSPHYEVKPRWGSHTMVGQIINFYTKWIWPTMAVLVPLPILLFCNLRLIQGLKRVPQHRRNGTQGQKVKNVNTRITLTLVIIIFVAIALVTPAETLKFINPYRLWGEIGHTLASVANLLQAISFAFNFVLYSTIDVTFRKICRNFMKIKCLIPPKGDSQVNILKKGGTATSQKGSTRIRWKIMEPKQ